jgi:hypothetical protein
LAWFIVLVTLCFSTRYFRSFLSIWIFIHLIYKLSILSNRFVFSINNLVALIVLAVLRICQLFCFDITFFTIHSFIVISKRLTY